MIMYNYIYQSLGRTEARGRQWVNHSVCSPATGSVKESIPIEHYYCNRTGRCGRGRGLLIIIDY